MLTDKQDAFGHEIYDSHRGISSFGVIERDDGYVDYVDVSQGTSVYFAPYRRWAPFEKKAMRYVTGRVLDIGCGAGRVLLHLQERGLECVGIDNSPLAIKVCRERGAKDARIMSVTQVGPQLGVFDSLVMFGNNFGLLESRKRAKWLLQRFHRITTPKARIIAASADPYATKKPEHLWYHQFNRKHGRMGGQLRMRLRYEKYATPWFDYLLVSREEMVDLLTDTGWQVKTFIDSSPFMYVAIIEKT
jgi:SAM-dependent methyltransferase